MARNGRMRLDTTAHFKRTPLTKELTQYCIDAYLFDEVMNLIPQEIKIQNIQLEAGTTFGKRKVIVPNHLKSLGVSYMREPYGQKEIYFNFEGISRAAIKKNVIEACSKLGLSRAMVKVRSIVLLYDGAEAYFVRTKKSIKPDETDLRKKLTVLGVVSGAGQMSKLYEKLSVKQYSCKFETVETRIVRCAKMT